MSALYKNFSFDVDDRDPDSKARLGRLNTPHGTVQTPNFIFCGTKATVKGITPRELKEAGTQYILANTYNLMIQPGADLIERMGGIHKFMGWDGPMLTDSGGYQIFSMGGGANAKEMIKSGGPQVRKKTLTKITEEGARFRSYKNGQEMFLSPEVAMDLQKKIGADIVMPLDECTSDAENYDYTARSVDMSHRWETRSLEAFKKGDDGRQALYGIVQGATFPDLRKYSAEYTKENDFFGTAIGGSFGKNKDDMYKVLDDSMPYTHPDRPVHFLGVGGIGDVFEGVRRGIDTLDCVSPTRIARHGCALLKGHPNEKFNIKNAANRESHEPIDPTCDCYTCKNFTRSYLHHLVRAGEVLAIQLITLHNVRTMNRLMADVRAAIKSRTLDAAQKEWTGQ